MNRQYSDEFTAGPREYDCGWLGYALGSPVGGMFIIMGCRQNSENYHGTGPPIIPVMDAQNNCVIIMDALHGRRACPRDIALTGCSVCVTLRGKSSHTQATPVTSSYTEQCGVARWWSRGILTSTIGFSTISCWRHIAVLGTRTMAKRTKFQSDLFSSRKGTKLPILLRFKNGCQSTTAHLLLVVRGSVHMVCRAVLKGARHKTTSPPLQALGCRGRATKESLQSVARTNLPSSIKIQITLLYCCPAHIHEHDSLTLRVTAERV